MQTLLRCIVQFFFFLLLFAAPLSGQIRYFDQWQFGNGLALDFRNGAPVLGTSRINTPEGCASICDPVTGDLLFYTDGRTVWNRLHQVMADGTGLFGQESGTQTALIVPRPGTSHQFYLFTSGVHGRPDNGIYYSLVDMNEDGGLGRIIEKNTLLLNSADEKLVAVRACNGQDFWVVGHRSDPDNYYAWSVTRDGVSDTAVVSLIDRSFSSIGVLKASPDGRFLFSMIGFNLAILLHFDNVDGVVGPRILTLPGRYGASFSPNSRYLYTAAQKGTGDELLQYDVSVADSASIAESRISIRAFPSPVKGMQIGPDRKLYVMESFLTVLNNPDARGDGADLQTMNLSLWEYYGFPNCIDGFLGDRPDGSSSKILTPDTTICFGDSVLLQAFGGRSFRWTGLPNDACDKCPLVKIAPEESATYVVTVKEGNACPMIDSVRIEVRKAEIGFPADTVLCPGDSLLLPTSGGLVYRWSPVQGLSCADCPAPVARPNSSVTYTVEIELEGGCVVRDSIRVNIPSQRAGRITVDDTLVCRGTEVRLSASGGLEYEWFPKDGLSCDECPSTTVKPEQTTTYILRSTVNGRCPAFDSVQIVVHENPVVTLNPDTVICAGDSVVLSATGGKTYRWLNDAGLSCNDCPNPVARPVSTTLYRVEVENEYGCRALDSVLVTVRAEEGVRAWGDTSICPGSVVSLHAEGSTTYRWSPAEGLSCVGCPAPEVRPEQSTTYYVVGTNAEGGCGSLDSVRVEVLENPEAEAGPDVAVCAGEAIHLSGSGGGIYRWDASPDLSCVDCPDPLVRPTRTGMYYLTVESEGGCTDRDSVQVIVHPFWEVDAGPGGSLCAGESLQLQAEGGVRWEWSPSEGLSCTECPDPVATPGATMVYRLVAYDANGCVAEDSVEVQVSEGGRIIPVRIRRDHHGSIGEVIELPVELTEELTESDISEIELEVQYNSRVLLVADDQVVSWLQGSLLEGWSVEEERRTEGSLYLHLLAPAGSSLAGAGDLLRLRVRLFLANESGTDLTLGIRTDGRCYDLTPVSGYVEVDSICGLNFRLIELTAHKYVTPVASPNPARDRVTFEFGLGLSGPVKFSVYSEAGLSIGTLVDAELDAGSYQVDWDVHGLPTGTYLYRIRSGDWVRSGQVRVMK